MAGGRPTKYKKEYCEKVDEYLAMRQDYIDDTNPNRIKVNLPTIGDFALFINVPERCLYDWREKHPEFSQSLSKLVKAQEKRLLDNGLAGTYNSTIAKLVLSANHGMAEKTEQKQEVTHHLDNETKNLIDKALDDV